MGSTRRPLVVLGSVPPPRPTTNPYSIMLIEAIRAEPDVRLVDFSWRRALFGPYDVFHAHWPESLMGGRWPMRLVRQGLFLLLVLRIAITRPAIVRTQHNVGQPTGLTWSERLLLDAFERRTTLFIVLNRHTPVHSGAPVVLIPHGHYRDWYARYPRADAEDGRFGYYGVLRRYKGVEQLIAAFRETADVRPGYRLVIAGRPSGPELADQLRTLSEADERIDLRIGFQSPEDLVRIATASRLVVLPYRLMHNSGAILAALSLDRPVLVPDNEVTRDLSDEVGPGWIHTFEDTLTAEDLVRSMTAVEAAADLPAPDLSAREWSDTGRRHVEAFRQAERIRHPRRRGRPDA